MSIVNVRGSRYPAETHIMRGRIAQAKREAGVGNLLLWRLFSGDNACSNIFEATEDEAMQWNSNSRQFYYWRISLGKETLPLLKWRLEKDDRSAKTFQVNYTEAGIKKMREVLANNAGHARSEFAKWANVVARIISVTEINEGNEAK